jgi:hypothetical protein
MHARQDLDFIRDGHVCSTINKNNILIQTKLESIQRRFLTDEENYLINSLFPRDMR